MHERALVQGLLEQVDALRRERVAQRVVSIRVSVGEFSGVELDLFRYAYDDLVAATPLFGAELELSRVPLRARCTPCGDDFAVVRFRFECPDCQGRDVRVVSGQELVLESIAIEEEEPDPTEAGVRP